MLATMHLRSLANIPIGAASTNALKDVESTIEKRLGLIGLSVLDVHQQENLENNYTKPLKILCTLTQRADLQ